MKLMISMFLLVPVCAAQKVVYVSGTAQTEAVNEVRKKKECSRISLTAAQDKAEFVLTVDRDEYRAHWMLSDREGRVIGSGETRKVSNSVKDACESLK